MVMDRRLVRHARARHDEVDVGQEIGTVLAESELDARGKRTRLGPERGRGLRVRDPHTRPPRCQQCGHGAARPSEADDERSAGRFHQRSFSVESASRAHTTETIQKRTMICGSGQPSSSK